MPPMRSVHCRQFHRHRFRRRSRIRDCERNRPNRPLARPSLCNVEAGLEVIVGVFDGELRMLRDRGTRVNVQIDVADERLRLISGDVELGNWPLDQIVVNSQPDGFHLRAEGEEIILEIAQDAEFALAIGLRTGPPLLVRKMSALLREGRE